MKTALNRHTPPQAGPLTALRLPPYESHRLSNGLAVYLLPYGKTEVVELQWIFRAGKNYQSLSGLGNYTLRNMQEGTAAYTGLELAQQLDQYGAWLSHYTGEEISTLSLATVTKQLTHTLPILKEVLLHPQFPEQEFDRMKTRSLQNLEVKSQKTTYQARRKFGHLLFGAEHPYGRHFGREEVAALQLRDLVDFHQAYLYPGNSMLAVTGKFDRDVLLERLEEEFGSLSMQSAPELKSMATKELQTDIQRLHLFREGPQSTIRVGHLGIPREHEDFDGMRVVTTLLGGFFGSRLMKKIRVEKGYTYGIYASWAGMKHQGYLVAQTDVANQYVEPTLAAIRDEMEKLRQEPPSQEELQLVKNYLIGQSINQRETPFQMGEILRYSLGSGTSFEELDRRFAVIQEITPEQIRELAHRWFQPQDMLEVVCGGEVSK
jgi:zinc protease